MKSSASRGAIVLVLCTAFFNAAAAGVITNFQYLAAVKANDEGRFTDAAARFEKLVDSKDSGVAGDAALRLHRYFSEGLGVRRDLRAALRYLDLAYASPDPRWSGSAAFQKGMYAHFGLEGLIPVDRVAAWGFYGEAQARGHEVADDARAALEMFPDVYVARRPEYFGPIARNGQEVAPGSVDAAVAALSGGDRDHARLVLLWHARRGDELAQYAMAASFGDVKDEQSQRERMGWVYLSARNGRAESQAFYGQYLVGMTKAPVAEGIGWVGRGAEQGYGFAENLLGVYALEGVRGLAVDPEDALRRFRRAVELGSTTAMINLGDLYATGTAVAADRQTAIDLYSRAAGLGDPLGAERLQARYGITATPATALGAAETAVGPPRPNIDRAALLMDKRVALVIGNAAYERAPLRNPVNDARLMATELRKAGFKIFQLENGSLEAMYSTIDRFSQAIPEGGVALVYFAGHGVQVQGENFLVPVGASLNTETDAKYRSVNLGYVLGKLEESKPGISLVFLDACRDNPFARSWRSGKGGLASIDAPAGTLIAFSTAPGQVALDGEGPNGLFTGALAQELARPNLKIEDILKNTRRAVSAGSRGQQVPWDSSSLMGDFFFHVSP
jgi:TPR repeat protein